MSNVSFQSWSDAVRQSYLARHGVIDSPTRDQDAAYAAWMAGIPDGTFAASLPTPVPAAVPMSIPAPAAQPTFTTRPAPPPAWSRPPDDGRPARVMWTLTAFVVLLGVLWAFLYSRDDLDSLRVVQRVAVVLDLPACVLALVCLCRPSIRARGLAKIGWEVAVGVSLYFLTVGLARDTGRVYREGYAKGGASGAASGFDSGARSGYGDGVSAGVASGERAGYADGVDAGIASGAKAGYEDGDHEGFNAGAQQQLSHDRAAVGGYGYRRERALRPRLRRDRPSPKVPRPSGFCADREGERGPSRADRGSSSIQRA